MGNESLLGFLCSFSFFPSRILLREQRYRDRSINSHFEAEIFPRLSKGKPHIMNKSPLSHFMSRLVGIKTGFVVYFRWKGETQSCWAIICLLGESGDLNSSSDLGWIWFENAPKVRGHLTKYCPPTDPLTCLVSSPKNISHLYAEVFLFFRRFYRVLFFVRDDFFPLPLHNLSGSGRPSSLCKLVSQPLAAGEGGTGWFYVKIAHSA